MKPEDFEKLLDEYGSACDDTMRGARNGSGDEYDACMSAIRSLCAEVEQMRWQRSEFQKERKHLETLRDALQARLQVAELDAERLLKMNHNLADQLAIDRLSIKDPDIAALAKEQPR